MTTSLSDIPDAAVEAAALAWCGTRDLRDWQRRHITKLLEAAAPHLTERAYNAGHLDGMIGSPNTNPYGVAK